MVFELCDTRGGVKRARASEATLAMDGEPLTPQGTREQRDGFLGSSAFPAKQAFEIFLAGLEFGQEPWSDDLAFDDNGGRVSQFS